MDNKHVRLRNGMWGCFNCKFRKNTSRAVKCSICESPKPPHRITVRIADSFFLCVAHTSDQLKTVSVLRVGKNGSKSVAEPVKLIMTSDSTILSECVREALDVHLEEEVHVSFLAQSKFDEPVSVSLFDSTLESSHVKEESFLEQENVPAGKSSYSDKKLEAKISLEQAMKENVRRKKEDQHIHDIGITSPTTAKANYFNVYERCALCEFSFPVLQLQGKISFRAIIEWKKSHGVDEHSLGHMKDPTRLYDQAKLCLFCFQIFDTEGFSNILSQKAELQQEIFGGESLS